MMCSSTPAVYHKWMCLEAAGQEKGADVETVDTLAHALQPAQVGFLQCGQLNDWCVPPAPCQLCEPGGSPDGAGVAAAYHEYVFIICSKIRPWQRNLKASETGMWLTPRSVTQVRLSADKGIIAAA